MLLLLTCMDKTSASTISWLMFQLIFMPNLCLSYQQGNFMDMPFPDNTFDAIYAIEATSYATDLVHSNANACLNICYDLFQFASHLFQILLMPLWLVQVACYKEICRVLKPGQCFASYELCLTEHFDPRNEKHQKIKADIELGSALPYARTTSQCLEALKLAGFEVRCQT